MCLAEGIGAKRFSAMIWTGKDFFKHWAPPKPRRLTFTIAAGNVIESQFFIGRGAQTTVQIRKEVRKDEG
jgi:hypothetical protein